MIPAIDTAAVDSASLFRVQSAACGHGRVAADGTLGYSCALTDHIMAPGAVEGAEFLSAHAPSRVEVELLRPARVTGFLNATARWMPDNPAVFLVNENPVGLAFGPLEQTLPLTLAPGRHVLRTVCANYDSRHTVWRLDPVAEAPAHRLALVTVGCYPEAESWRSLWHLCQSAVSQDRWLHVMGVGTRLVNLYEAKVVRLREYIAALCEEYVLFTDGKDSFLAGGEDEVLEEFERMGTDCVVSMERGSCPVWDGEWMSAFPRVADARHFPNSGGWMGTKAGVLRVLDRCRELYALMARGALPGGLRRWQKFAGALMSMDQGLFQLCYLEGSLEGDLESRIFFTELGRAACPLAERLDFYLSNGRLQVKATGATPPVIHFPGPACGVLRDQLVASLANPETAAFKSVPESSALPEEVDTRYACESDANAGCRGGFPDTAAWTLWVYWESGPMPDYLAECMGLMRLWHPGAVRLVTWEIFESELWTRDRDVPISDLHVVTRCDWIRLYLLRWYGGMYADLDCIPLRDWTPWLEEARRNTGGFCGFGSTRDHVATSLMAARAGGLIITLAYEAASRRARHQRPIHWLDLNSGVMTPAARGRESQCRIFPIAEVQPIGWWEQACYFEEGDEFPLPEGIWCLMLSNQQLGERGRGLTREQLRTGRTRLAFYLRESRRRVETARLPGPLACAATKAPVCVATPAARNKPSAPPLAAGFAA